jgi:hypothetical protein
MKLWAKIVDKMSGPALVTAPKFRTVSKAEWDKLLMPIYPDPEPLNTRDPGY